MPADRVTARVPSPKRRPPARRFANLLLAVVDGLPVPALLFPEGAEVVVCPRLAVRLAEPH
ncbi:hypothetical protein GCM10020358_44630 [Amorphoplanes nipponensis]